MADEKYNYKDNDQFSATAPARRHFDVILGTAFPVPTRAIMVSDTGALTGTLVGDDGAHTTFDLEPGIMYPMAFKQIDSTTNSITVKAYY